MIIKLSYLMYLWEFINLKGYIMSILNKKISFFDFKFKKSSVAITIQRKQWLKEFLKIYYVVCFGYAMMYVVRNNFKAAQPLLKTEFGFTTTELGYIGLGFSISYGIGRTLLGYFFDGKNTKKILSALLTTSALVAILIGGVLAMEGKVVGFLIVMWTINGMLQATGGPCSFSTIVRWTPISRRGSFLGWWNIAHNVGGALAGVVALWGANMFFNGSVIGMFIFPGMVGLVFGVTGLFIGSGDPRELGWDTPEEIFNEPPEEEDEESVGMSKWEIFKKYVITNPFVWMLCITTLFNYVIRIGVDNWAPLYVAEHLNFDMSGAVQTILYFEFGGFFGSLIWGWLSDICGGRKAALSIVCFALLVFAMIGYRTSTTMLGVSVSLFFVGLLIYGPILLVGIAVIGFAPKEATTVTSAIPGTFGYIFGDSIAKVLIAKIADPKSNGVTIFGFSLHGWNDQFILFFFSMAAASALLFVVAIAEEKKIRRRNILIVDDK